MRIAMGVEYDGSRFHGWQTQQSARSVQTEVEKALSQIANTEVQVCCAGRTDAGVHAYCQVIHFNVEAVRQMRGWVMGSNTLLPDDAAIIWAQQIDDGFHARFSATARYYRYQILNRTTSPAIERNRMTWVYSPLDVARMDAATSHLLGKHDFSSYRAVACQAKHAVREIHHLSVRREGEVVIIEVVANAFLQHMVRNIAGVLISIGKGDHEPEWAADVLGARDRTQGGVTAPPDGLYFMGVYYPDYNVVPWPGAHLYAGKESSLGVG